MGLFDDIKSLWEYIAHGQFGELDNLVPQTVVKADKDAPNLFIGKIIDDGAIKCEVVDLHHTNMHVKILEIKWDRITTYLDLDKVYPVFKHSGWGENMQVWEISGKRMKRSTSQLILQWEKGVGWMWDLDM